jgi:hypothetical protein
MKNNSPSEGSTTETKDLTAWKREVLSIRQHALNRWSDHEFEEHPELISKSQRSFLLT